MVTVATTHNTINMTTRTLPPYSRTFGWCLTLLVGFLATVVLFWWNSSDHDVNSLTALFGGGGDSGRSPATSSRINGPPSRNRSEVMQLLEQKHIYSASDYANDQGVVVPYWDTTTTNATAKRRIPKATTTAQWGPCYAPHAKVNWDREIAKYSSDQTPEYEKSILAPGINSMDEEDLAGFCRPGFIIIGAGKCGTSSLYHYLTEHPRVLPASMKQIHYFKYYADRTMKWYLHHFPKTTSFLASGALLTGEASPGYLPYPDVARMVRQRLGEGPRFIAVGREPVDRAYSSYRYNYVHPTIEFLSKGRVKGIQRGQSDEYYEQYLFSFEDMMKAELKALRECLSVPMGSSVFGASEKFGSQPIFEKEYKRRQKQGLPPLVDLDGFCYGGKVDDKVPRKQWIELMEKYPEKVIGDDKLLHLKQSFIGRGLYTLPLEWWYAVYNPSDIYFVCTEELRDMSGEPLNRLGQFLGLSSYNFSNSVSKGAYNVGGHRGYDKEISWDAIETEKESNATTSLAKSRDIPLSDEFREELEAFIMPYNERLFELVGRRCDW